MSIRQKVFQDHQCLGGCGEDCNLPRGETSFSSVGIVVIDLQDTWNLEVIHDEITIS